MHNILVYLTLLRLNYKGLAFFYKRNYFGKFITFSRLKRINNLFSFDRTFDIVFFFPHAVFFGNVSIMEFFFFVRNVNAFFPLYFHLFATLTPICLRYMKSNVKACVKDESVVRWFDKRPFIFYGISFT